jgi:hypothetical protein
MHIRKSKARASSHMRQLHSQPATLLQHPQVGRYNGEADETDAADAVAVQQPPPPAAPALRAAARERSLIPILLLLCLVNDRAVTGSEEARRRGGCL